MMRKNSGNTAGIFISVLMKATLFIFLTIILNGQGLILTNSDVYLCDSNGGKKYHYTKNCRGLSNCDHEIIKVNLKKAQDLGKELCGWEN